MPVDNRLEVDDCSCCCGPNRNELPFGRTERIAWYADLAQWPSLNMIGDYATLGRFGSGSGSFSRVLGEGFMCHRVWDPATLRYQIDRSATIYTYVPQFDAPRAYRQAWRWDDTVRGFLPVDPSTDGFYRSSFTDAEDHQAYMTELLNRGAPGAIINSLYGTAFGRGPYPGEGTSGFINSDAPLAMACLFPPFVIQSINADGGKFSFSFARGIRESSGYTPSPWESSCVRARRGMFDIRQKLVQHVVSLDGAYDFEEVLYPVGENPWSFLAEGARAFSFSRIPNQHLGSEIWTPTGGAGIAEVRPSWVRDGSIGGGWADLMPDLWNISLEGFNGAAPVTFDETSITIRELGYGTFGTPLGQRFISSFPVGPTATFDYDATDLWKRRLTITQHQNLFRPSRQIQVSVDQRQHRWQGSQYGLWYSNLADPNLIPGFGFPSFYNNGYLRPDWATSVESQIDLGTFDSFTRSLVEEDITQTYGRNRWITLNPVVYFFRDFLWLGGKYRLCEITITEGNADHSWQYPEGYTQLNISPTLYWEPSFVNAPFQNLASIWGWSRANTGEPTAAEYHRASYRLGIQSLYPFVTSWANPGPRYVYGNIPVTGDYSTSCIQITRWVMPVWKFTNSLTGEIKRLGGHKLTIEPGDLSLVMNTPIGGGIPGTYTPYPARYRWTRGPHGSHSGETLVEGLESEGGQWIPGVLLQNGPWDIEVETLPTIEATYWEMDAATGAPTGVMEASPVIDCGGLKYWPTQFNACGIQHEYQYNFIAAPGVPDPTRDTWTHEDYTLDPP